METPDETAPDNNQIVNVIVPPDQMEARNEDVAPANPNDQNDNGEIPQRNPLTENVPQNAKPKGRPAKNAATLKLKVEKLENEKRALSAKVKEKSTLIETKNAILQELETKCRSLELENSKLIRESHEVKENQNSLQSELCDAQTRISDLEQERDEIMEQLSSSNNDISLVSSPLASGLLICDLPTKDVMKMIENSHIHFDAKAVDARRLLVEVSPDDISHYDLIIILCGSADIRNGAKGLEICSLITNAAAEFSKDADVYLITLPPSRSKGGAGSSTLFNFKLANKYNAPNDRIHVINMEYPGGKDELLDVDNLPTQKCAWMMKEAINKSISVPSSPKSVSSVAKEECFNMTQFMEIDKKDIGRVIGKAGSTISKLTSDFKVSMSIGKWLERSKDDRDSFVEITQAVLIGGKNDRVKACHSALCDMLAAEPPVKKKKNWLDVNDSSREPDKNDLLLKKAMNLTTNKSRKQCSRSYGIFLNGSVKNSRSYGLFSKSPVKANGMPMGNFVKCSNNSCTVKNVRYRNPTLYVSDPNTKIVKKDGTPFITKPISLFPSKGSLPESFAQKPAKTAKRFL